MSARRAICGCVWKPSGQGIKVLTRCAQHRSSSVPLASRLASVAFDVVCGVLEPDEAAAKLDGLYAGRDERERAEMAEHFETALARWSFDRLLDPGPAVPT